MILDVGGGSTLSRLRRALAPTGRLVIVGSETGGRLLGGFSRTLRTPLLSPFVSQDMGGVVPRFHTASWSSPNLLGSTMKSRGWKRGGTDAPGLWTGPGMSPLAYPVTSPGLVADIRGQNLVSGAGHLHCVRVEAVLLADADVPLLVEFGRQDGTTGGLEVTHLEAIRSQRSDDVEPQRDEEPAAGDATAPPVTASDPLHLVLSHEQVASTGQTIALAVVNASDSEFSYGADGALERWHGAAWEEVADVVLSRTWWESGGGVAGPENPNLALPDIQYSAPPGGAGEPEWLTLPMLDTGWYRLVRGGGSRQAMAVFQVVAVDEPLEPVLAVPWEDSYLSLDVAAIGPAGGLLDMVPAEGSEVAGRPHGEDIERAAQLSRWEQGEWTSSRGAALDLDPDEPVGNTRAVRVSIPQLDPGFWRVQVEAADGGELTGYFWVVDQLAGEGNTGSASAGAGESFHPLASEARTVDAATASAQRRRFDEVHGDSYAATIDVRSSSGEPSPPYRIEIRDEMISRVTLQLEDGTEEDISDQLARHNVVSVGWIMDQIEGAAARSDATFTAVYDEQGVPRFVRFEDGTSPDLSAVEYLVTDVIRLPD